jgi:hypothetical protein
MAPFDTRLWGTFDTRLWRYFTRGVSDPASTGDFSPALGEDEIISKNSETINKPAIPAPINICAPYIFLSTPCQIAST